MVQPTLQPTIAPSFSKRTLKVRPSGTLGGGKNGLLGEKFPDRELPGMHVRSAKELRKTFVELQTSPDGTDPDPLTVPKVVECGHCGWPVHPRESKVATKMTFARAGIVRGTKKEEEAKKAATGGGVIVQEEDAGSEDSRNTEERLRMELEELQEKKDELEKENMDLKHENEELTAKVQELNLTIEEQFDRIEFLEEAEEKWRDKLMQAEIRMEDLTRYLDQSGMVSADRERGLVCALEEIAELRRTIKELEATIKEQAEKIGSLEEANQQLRDELARARQRIEELLQFLECNGMASADREKGLECRVEDLEERKRELENVIAELKKEMAKLEGTIKELETISKEKSEKIESLEQEAAAQLQDFQRRSEEYESAHAEVCSERDGLATELEKQKALVQLLKEESAGTERAALEAALRGSQLELEKKLESAQQELKSTRQELEALREETSRRIEELQRQVDEASATLLQERKTFAQEKADFEQEIEALENRLEVAEAAVMMSGMSGNTVPEVDEASRIVPKGQGVLCVGCLKQLVHRGVRPLPPVEKLPRKAEERLEKAKDLFFEQELRGMPGTDDTVHKHVWRSRKDPYGIARLTVWPRTSQTKGLQASSSMGSLPTHDLEDAEPRTGLPPLSEGLPTLRRTQKLRQEGVASPMRRTQRDFRANFRS